MRWGRLGLFTSFTAAAASSLLVAALTTSSNADAQGAHDAGDAGAGRPSTCTFTASGIPRPAGPTSSGTCKTRVLHQPGADASRTPTSTWFYIDGDSPELRSVSVWLVFIEAPQGAIVHSPANMALPWFGRSEVTATNKAEWVAIVGVQGKFDLNLTTIRSIRVEGGISYELHGDLEIELPPPSVSTPLTLHVSF